MKILFVSEDYYPSFAGVPVVVKYLAEGLVKKGFEVTVATAIDKDSRLKLIELYNGVEIVRFHVWRNVAKILCGDIEGIQNYVLENIYDVVIVECGQAATTDAILPVLKKIRGTKIFHSHGLSGLLPTPWFKRCVDFKHTLGHTYNKIRMKYYYGCWFKKYASAFDGSICLTKVDSGYEYVVNHISPTYILGNAVDNYFFEPAGVKYQKPWGNKPYILSIANYVPLKGQIDMVRQFYMCNHNDYALVMIGSHENEYYRQVKEENKKLARQNGLRDVFFLTGVDRKYFPDILDGASLYLVASSIEVFSISLIEAMSRGIPYISTNVGNARLLPGGVVLDKIEAFHNVIDRLLDDDIKRKYLGREGREYAYKNCRKSVVVDKLESIITSIRNENHHDTRGGR